VTAFNDNRRRTVAASSTKVFDESMSAYRPQTTKTGGLPHISFIMRKPEDLGTELKVVADTESTLFIGLEIQEGKHPMRAKDYSNEKGATAGCCLHLAEMTAHCGQQENDGLVDKFIGDSWFGSLVCCEELKERGYEGVFVIKTGHSKTPKAEIEKTMEN
jgi:hypothetical protein